MFNIMHCLESELEKLRLYSVTIYTLPLKLASAGGLVKWDGSQVNPHAATVDMHVYV